MKTQQCFVFVLLALPSILAHEHHHQHGHHHMRGTEHSRDLRANDVKSNRMPQPDFDPSIEERILLDTAHNKWMMQHENQRRNLASETISVPVAVTVVVNSTDVKVPSNGWLDDVGLARALLALNRSFRDTPFTFKLLQMRHVYDLDFFDGNPAYEKEFKTKYRVAKPNVLNLYFCNTLENDSRLLSYTYLPVRIGAFPEGDGVVFLNPAIQEHTTTSLTHQIGHWLGLLHTWTDGCNPELTYKASYNGVDYFYLAGDGVSDTPAHSGPTWAVVNGRTSCWKKIVLDTCNATVEAANFHIDAGVDPVNNYMNEAPARCYFAHGYFTPGQVTRMVAVWEVWRKQVTIAPTQAPTTVSRSCRKRKETCRRDQQCCGTMNCVVRPGKKKGTCRRCRSENRRCRVGAHCCSGRCTNNRCEA